MKTENLVMIVAAALIDPAQAELLNRGGGLIYDDVQNVTWLEDAAGMNPNRPVFLGAWEQAANFTFYDVLRDQLLDDWRLPKQAELASLWIQGVRGGSGQLSSPFKNLVDGPYWGWDWVQPIPNSEIYSGNWDFKFGGWAPVNNSYNLYAMPVRVGDVGPPPISEPASLAFMLAGLGTLVLAIRRKA